MNKESHTHIVKYRLYFFVLLALLVLTFISVAITHINLGKAAVIGALLLATIKSSLVLWHFMHLKYENRIIRLMVAFVLFLFLVVMVITFLDYGFQ